MWRKCRGTPRPSLASIRKRSCTEPPRSRRHSCFSAILTPPWQKVVGTAVRMHLTHRRLTRRRLTHRRLARRHLTRHRRLLTPRLHVRRRPREDLRRRPHPAVAPPTPRAPPPRSHVATSRRHALPRGRVVDARALAPPRPSPRRRRFTSPPRRGNPGVTPTTPTLGRGPSTTTTHTRCRRPWSSGRRPIRPT